jgi:hypothetical protein
MATADDHALDCGSVGLPVPSVLVAVRIAKESTLSLSADRGDAVPACTPSVKEVE